MNYVLGTGLHAYGFGNSPIVKWMAAIALAGIVFLTWGWASNRKQPEREAVTAG